MANCSPATIPTGYEGRSIISPEALQRIDALLCPVIEGPASASPPPAALVGSCYLVAAGASGAWSGHDGALACFSEGGWRFVAPVEGMSVLERSSGQMLTLQSGAWETGILRGQELRVDGVTVVRNRQSGIGDPSGGTVADAECRAAVSQILSALRAHGLIG